MRYYRGVLNVPTHGVTSGSIVGGNLQGDVYRGYLRLPNEGYCLCADAVTSIHSRCSPLTTSAGETPAVELHGRGYLSSPNYPDKYYMDAECRWRVRVQPRQTIRFTIFDFELDIKRAGRCKDYVQISSASSSTSWYWPSSSSSSSSSPAPPTTHFRDCGALGRHTVEVNSSVADIRFVVDASSLTQRGFFIYFEGTQLNSTLLSASWHTISRFSRTARRYRLVPAFKFSLGRGDILENISRRGNGFMDSLPGCHFE